MTLSVFVRSRALRHGLVWVLVLALIGLLALLEPAGAPEKLRRMAVLLPVAALVIYAHFWLLTRLLEQRRYGRYVLATSALMLSGAALLVLLNQLAHVVQTRPGGHTTFAYLLGLAAGNLVLATVLATLPHYVRRGVLSHYRMQELHARQLETELSLLKAQVNQHFLFNTLNNLYGLSLAAPDQMPEALLQLAGLMRYQLDSSRQHLVTVGTEAEYLANYIGLEKLRLRANSHVEFTVDLPHPDQPLAPLLLLPLVENCFKHAIGPSGDNTIRITLSQTPTGLTLRTENSIPPHFKPTPSGLGLPNLRARLAQFYPGPRHQLTLNATATHYTAELRLQL
ncbi:sensor histidine kinase [Hymenobacter canadensis]|uniref:Sensor histidine kinase n=1 Tax=Hymenobacter canadensis TaxID=2999067 RepID=A0ABY7LS34_9BACT|nr:sensor histidine kinase [Hymenobacter canadensis]WBA41708.1 sensor histidine kinase [Hymenobacter canadensis]